MKVNSIKLKGAYIISLEPKIDKRGSFTRIFCQKEFAQAGILFNIAQINRSLTKKKGTIRGMHYQTKPFEEDKIVACTRGSVYDVTLDLRKTSTTFGQWISQELNATNNKAILIPKGCAHGFQALTADCELQYFMSEFYSPAHYHGVRWNDTLFNIKWPIDNVFISDTDSNWPLFQ